MGLDFNKIAYDFDSLGIYQDLSRLGGGRAAPVPERTPREVAARHGANMLYTI